MQLQYIMYPNTIVEIYMCIHLVWGYNLVWGYCIANQNQCMTTKPCFGLLFKNHLSMVSVTCQNNLNNKQPLVFLMKRLTKNSKLYLGLLLSNDPSNRSLWLFVSKPRHQKNIFSITAHSVLCTTNLVSTSFGMLFWKIFSTNNMHETYFLKKHFLK